METTQLQCMIECDPVLQHRVLDVYAADMLPIKTPSPPYGFIVNTDVHSKQGQHWCAFYCETKGHFDFFDSYGRRPAKNSPFFQQWLQEHATVVHTNDIQIQSDTSTVCGLYCIMFLRMRCIGYSYREFMNYFDVSTPEVNDLFVSEVVCNSYSHCVQTDGCKQRCLPLHVCVSEH